MKRILPISGTLFLVIASLWFGIHGNQKEYSSHRHHTVSTQSVQADSPVKAEFFELEEESRVISSELLSTASLHFQRDKSFHLTTPLSFPGLYFNQQAQRALYLKHRQLLI